MQHELEKKWAEIVAKAWTDESFKRRLFSDPSKVLKEFGIDLHGKQFKMHENSKDTFHCVFPSKPEGHLSEQKLKDIAAASSSLICL